MTCKFTLNVASPLLFLATQVYVPASVLLVDVIIKAWTPPSLTKSLWVESSMTWLPLMNHDTSGKGLPLTRRSNLAIFPSVTSLSPGILTKFGFRALLAPVMSTSFSCTVVLVAVVLVAVVDTPSLRTKGWYVSCWFWACCCWRLMLVPDVNCCCCCFCSCCCWKLMLVAAENCCCCCCWICCCWEYMLQAETAWVLSTWVRDLNWEKVCCCFSDWKPNWTFWVKGDGGVTGEKLEKGLWKRF